MVVETRVKLIRAAVVVCAIAALFYFIYTQSFDVAAGVVLVVFFAFFMNLLKPGVWRFASEPSPTNGRAVRSPIRELAKGLVCLLAGGVLAYGVGSRAPNVQLSVAIAVTAVIAGTVAFFIFLLNAIAGWVGRSSRGE
jgi:hypothetical protein